MHISIDNVLFEENHRDLTIEGMAALYLKVVESIIGTDVTIANCIFENNMAGYVPEDKLQNPQVISYKPGIITIRYNEMELNEEILVGKGGALALCEGKSITMQDCIFMNNSAYNFGGSIFQASPVGLTITNVSFEASGKCIAKHGQVIYALGYLFISSASFVVHKALAHVSIVQHLLSEVMSLTIFNTFYVPLVIHYTWTKRLH